MGINHSTSKSFSYAFEGIKLAIKKEPNLRIHIAIAAMVLLLGVFLRITPIEWILLTFTIFFVLVLELLNTVLEAIIDLVSPEVKDAAKTAKDVSATIVLLAAILSILVGIALFLPKILKLIS